MYSLLDCTFFQGRFGFGYFSAVCSGLLKPEPAFFARTVCGGIGPLKENNNGKKNRDDLSQIALFFLAAAKDLFFLLKEMMFTFFKIYVAVTARKKSGSNRIIVNLA